MKTSLKIEKDVHHAGVANANAVAYRVSALTKVIVAVSSITLKAELGVAFFPEELVNDKFFHYLCHGSNRFFEAIRLSDRTAFHISYVAEELVIRVNVTKGKQPVYCVELKFQAENKFDDGKFKEIVYL